MIEPNFLLIAESTSNASFSEDIANSETRPLFKRQEMIIHYKDNGIVS